MSDFETNPIGTMERLRRCEEALRDCRKELWDDWHAYMTVEQFNENSLIRDIDAALTPMTKPEQEGV